MTNNQSKEVIDEKPQGFNRDTIEISARRRIKEIADCIILPEICTWKSGNYASWPWMERIMCWRADYLII